ncbi:MAG: tetratricopeptide repeat protein [Treponemataceae bacterium]|nr:tetratricopeptide repeat protein [Treponemataceae bacterium]
MKKILKVCFLAFTTLILFSCNVTVKETYFTERLDSIDSLISRAQYEHAEIALKSLERKAVSPYHQMAIVKRYINMFDLENARHYLAKLVKKNPEDEKITAVYVWTLLKLGKTETACKYAEILKNTDYSGLYAQASLIKFAGELPPAADENARKVAYIKADLQNEYLSAYKVSNQVKFLQNAAIYECVSGNLKDAFSYHPIKLPNDESAEFWTLISYDSGNYLQAINDAEVIGGKNPSLKAKSYVISGDSYLRMNEITLARSMWDKAFALDELTDPNLLMNYSLSYLETGDYEDALKYTKKAVNTFPDYFPSLSLYCKFAIADSVVENESSLSRELRKRGLRSQDMIKKDSRERILISDAIHRMEKSYERTLNPEVQIELLQLKWASEYNLSKNQMIVDVWGLLENYFANEQSGDNRLLDFAIEFFMQQDKYDEARALLSKRLMNEFGDDDCIAHIQDLSYDECRMFAALKHHDKLDESAKMLLDQCLKTGAAVNDDVYINLGSFAEAEGRYQDAMNFYSLVINRSLNVTTKADLYYRLAMISLRNEDIKNTRSYLDYCLKLNPTHSDASLMQKKIRQQDLNSST